jgi:flagellar protein FliT
MPSILAPLEGFLAQTQSLLALAQADDWETFEIQMAERQTKLPALGESQLLIAITRAGLVDEAKSLIQAIQDTDQQIVGLAESSKAKISEQLRQSIKATKAVVAYKGL